MTHLTGPEHYREAERLVAEAQRMASISAPMVGAGAYPASEVLVMVATASQAAQVHATLALAAATSLASPSTAAQHIWEPVVL